MTMNGRNHYRTLERRRVRDASTSRVPVYYFYSLIYTLRLLSRQQTHSTPTFETNTAREADASRVRDFFSFFLIHFFTVLMIIIE